MSKDPRFFTVALPLGSDSREIEHTGDGGQPLEPVYTADPGVRFRKVPFPKVKCLTCDSSNAMLEVMRPPIFFDHAKLWLVIDGFCVICGDRFHGIAGEGQPYHKDNCTWFYVGDLS